jgi:hypothetical protein
MEQECMLNTTSFSRAKTEETIGSSPIPRRENLAKMKGFLTQIALFLPMERATSEAVVEAALSELAQLVPMAQRRKIVLSIYDAYRRKAAFCEDIESILAHSEIASQFEDRFRRVGSARYRLNTIRVREYIKGRNRRVKDDLLWACMCIGQRSNQTARETIRTLVESLMKRLGEVKQLLELEEITSKNLSRIPDHLLPPILGKALTQAIDERLIAGFLADRFLGDIPPLSEIELSEIRHEIVRKVNRLRKTSAVGQDDLIACVMNRVENYSPRIYSAHLYECAIRAIRSSRDVVSSGQTTLNRYLENVRHLRKNSKIGYIDIAINECRRSKHV